MAKVTVACCQIAPRIGAQEHNLRLAERAIREAARRGANVVVLPELAASGYVFADRGEALALAETRDGPSLGLWKALAGELDLVIVGGFCERLDPQRVANSAALVDADGVRAIYRKAHLWNEEGGIFEAGEQPPPVVATRFGRIAVMVCYDLEFPEWVRLPALSGAQLLCAPVNWPAAPRPEGERPAEVVRVQANASVNRLFIAACDRCGQERGVDWVGGSVIVDADGYPLDGPLQGEAGMLLARLDFAEADEKRISAHNHVHRDRRPELY
ncbi:nitrilase family protein [Pseudomonas aeruginosa]|uniref:nitrilase family protein n=1 Tax=Pseudomonas aeruginosa TaxID=287 RepID=UPI0022ADC117|nr:nitrilase family protein [Pseudomonas aeruginosa]MDV7782745.1 nitrilase family protein [Pseudomonas aeruginosa]HCT8043937.1 nitrilase family protein [Pseudomonas aeruginosa]